MAFLDISEPKGSRNIEANRFYVYLHLKPNGEVFYVGKGSRRRAWDRTPRNRYWKQVVDHHGFTVKIHTDKLNNKQALSLEKQLVDHYKTAGTLVNVADGGGGVGGTHVNLGVPKTESHKEKLRQCNLGKKQSQETVEKRKESIKKLLADGWVNPAKRQENKQLGVKNYNFAGFYNTPAGVFESLHQAAVANNCSDKTVKVRCRGNVCIVKSVKYVYQPKPGWSFSPKESA